MATIVERLISLMQIKTDPKALAQTNANLDSVRGRLTAIASVAAPAAVTAAVVGMFNESRAAADAAAKGARASGVTTEAYQEMGYAAALSGVQQNDLRTAMAKQAAKASQAAKGNKELRKVYRELGLDAKELVKLSPDKQMERIADALKNVDNESDRMRLMMKVFEEAGPKFASLFANGAKGIQDMRKEAQAMGIIISDKDAQRAEAFNDSLDKIKMIVRGVARNFNMFLLPALQPILDDMVKWSKEDAKESRQDIMDLAGAIGLIFKTIHSGMKDAREFNKTMGGTGNTMKFLSMIMAAFVAAGTLSTMAKGFNVLTLSMLKTAATAALFVLLILGIFVLLQDFAGWIEGEDSFLGDFLGPATPELIATIQKGLWGLLAVIGIIALIVGSIPVLIAAIIAMIIALIIYWDDVAKAGNAFVTGMSDRIDDFVEGVKTSFLDTFRLIFNTIKDWWKALIDGLSDRFLSMINKVKGTITDVKGFIDDPGGSVAKLFGGGASGPALDLAAGALTTINSRPQQNNTINVDVDGSNLTPEQLQQATSDGVVDGLLREAGNFFTGGAGGT